MTFNQLSTHQLLKLVGIFFSSKALMSKILYIFSLLDIYLLLYFVPVKMAKYSLFYIQETSSYLYSMVQPPSCTAPICNTCLYLVLCKNFFLHTSIQYDYVYHALIMVCFLCRNFFLHTSTKYDYILHVLSYHIFYRNIIGILFQIFFIYLHRHA